MNSESDDQVAKTAAYASSEVNIISTTESSEPSVIWQTIVSTRKSISSNTIMGTFSEAVNVRDEVG